MEKDFVKAAGDGGDRTFGQGVAGSETLTDDLSVALGDVRLAPVADDEQRYVVGGKRAEVRVDPEEVRAGGEFDAGFLCQFAGERLFDGLALLDAAARHVPAGTIGVLDEEEAVL